ncbi:MAG: hypothetical protein JSW71_01480 [Gemmatimonadota bacterium]|nr:MAG: hypothetical protein JSW71_01480 [Gemmatimonadota bacterium]
MGGASLIGLAALTLAGGILGSVGVVMLLRIGRIRVLVVRWKWWGMTLYFLAVIATLLGVVAWTFYSMVQSLGPNGLQVSSAVFFAFGFAAGLTFTLSPAFAVWRAGRQTTERSRKRRGRPASRRERLEFAQNLADQIRQFSPDLHDVEVVAQGEKGNTVAIHGGITREQAEKLVNVLRAELQELGIRRVESSDAGKTWWVRV